MENLRLCRLLAISLGKPEQIVFAMQRLATFFTVQRLTMLVFFLQPIAFGAWLPRIPEVQQALGLGPAALAVALLGLPCGTLLTLALAGPIVSRIGARATILLGFILFSIAVSLPPLAPDVFWLFFALMFAGSAISFVELGLNVMADLVEKATGVLIMNTSHGLWSLGIMVGTLIGAGFAAIGVSAGISIPLVAFAVLPVALVAGAALPALSDASRSESSGRSGWSPPGWALIGICCFVFGITLTEGVMADWSAIFLRDALGAEGGFVGLGYAVFALMVSVGRFGGDALKRRLGAVGAARLCGVLAITGSVLLYLAPNLPIALAGFAIIGVGVSVGFPLAVTAAASLTHRPAPANVAFLSLVALMGFLVGPPLVGFVAEFVDIRLGVACVIPMLLVSLLFSGRLTASARKPAPSIPQSS